MSEILLYEGPASDTPASGKVSLYVKTDKALYFKDDTGLETSLGGGAVSASNIVLTVRKGSAGTINKGEPVYLSGYNASGWYEIELADADDSAKMPAIGIAGENITNAASSTLVVVGNLTGMTTNSWSVGDGLYVSDSGTQTNTRPANADDGVQKIGTVARSHPSTGVIFVAGALRSNDIPNVQSDAVFRIGDNGDLTKAIVFQASGITTATTRTITMPDRDVNLGYAQDIPLVIKLGDETSDMTTGTGKVTFRLPFAVTVVDVAAGVVTAPTGSTAEFDINEGGVSILSTVISIDASEKTSNTAATPPVISDSSIAAHAEITIDIDQVGSSVAGAGAWIYMTVRQA